jgi:hypothetical protein
VNLSVYTAFCMILLFSCGDFMAMENTEGSGTVSYVTVRKVGGGTKIINCPSTQKNMADFLLKKACEIHNVPSNNYYLIVCGKSVEDVSPDWLQQEIRHMTMLFLIQKRK